MNQEATQNIVIKKSTHEQLSALKIHPRQSFDDVIQKLIQEPYK